MVSKAGMKIRYRTGRVLHWKSWKFSHPLAAPFGRFSLFFLFRDTWFIVKSPLLDLRKKSLFGQFLLEILYGPFYLIVLYDYLHILISFPYYTVNIVIKISSRPKSL
jgi:hypothetical protein